MKKVAIVLMLILLLCAYTGCAREGENINKAYPELSEKTLLYYASKDDVLSMLKRGTGMVLFTWKECSWCQRYIAYVDEISLKEDMPVMVYDIYTDREEKSDFYIEIGNLLEDSLIEKGSYDSLGKVRVYVPTLVAVDQGKVIFFDNETSMISAQYEDIEAAIDAYWNELSETCQTREYELKKRLLECSCSICKSLLEIENRGCNSCETGDWK